MKKNVYFYEALGIPEKRAMEISEDATQIIVKSGTVDAGLAKLSRKYDPEAVLAGMQALTLIHINGEVHKAKRLGDAKNASMN